MAGRYRSRCWQCWLGLQITMVYTTSRALIVHVSQPSAEVWRHTSNIVERTSTLDSCLCGSHLGLQCTYWTWSRPSARTLRTVCLMVHRVHHATTRATAYVHVGLRTPDQQVRWHDWRTSLQFRDYDDPLRSQDLWPFNCASSLCIYQVCNQQSRETVVGTSASITVSSVTTLNNTF